MRMAQATSAGVRLNYVDEGEGEPPLVFVPGWCSPLAFFRPQLDHFGARHRVIAFDPRGCGESEVPADCYDVPTLADDVAALCKELRVERPVVIGHSLGGMVAVELAGRHPSVPGAVVAVDPGPLAINTESRAIFEALIDTLEGPDGAYARREFIGRMFLASDDAERKRWIIDTMCAPPLHAAIAGLRGVVAWNGAGALQLCDVPLLILLSDPNVGGSNEPRRLLELKPDMQIGMTVRAGHFHQLEVPDQVNAMIERFLQARRSP